MHIPKIFNFILLLSYGSLAWASSLSELEHLLTSKRYAQAWQLARQLAPANEGEPQFDYLYGLSALETENYDYAVFALERVVVQQATAVQPRLALARAYLNIQNNSAALQEFRAVLTLNPPVEVRRNVQRFINELEQLAQQQKQTSQHNFNGGVSFAAGYDANANFGVDTATLMMPVLGTVVLDTASVRQASPFGMLQGQFGYGYEVSKDLSWFVNAGLGSKHYKKAPAFNTKQLALSTGMLLKAESKQYQLVASNRSLWLDNTKYQSVEAVAVSVAHHFANARTLSGTLSFDRQRFMQHSDRNASNVTAAVSYTFNQDVLQHHLQGTLSRGEAADSQFGHHAKHAVGLRYTVGRSWDESQSSSASLGYQYLRHLANDPVYAEARRDKRWRLNLRHVIKVSKKSSWFFEAGWTDNQSNLSLYDTDKSYVQTGLSYRF